ncbi:hypothetical protein [Curtobacterium sp. NPDC089689]|uniref:hypothetical protein n=1 Tax=Curtobacterium sp. NPDC089689 TaxID=3363968 RepID=UPI00381DE660
MNNGWRDGILAVWVVSLIAAIALWVTAVVLVNKGPDAIDLLAAVPFVAGAAALMTFWWFVSMLLWFAVSAIVREHHKDREALRRG